MLRSILSALIVFAISWTTSAAENADLDRLQGKWEVKKTSDEGQKITQTLEISKDKMLFKILNSDGDTVFVAKADVKLQKAGAFNAFTITQVKWGTSEDSLEPVDDDRSYVYQIGYQSLTIVSNIDQERDRPPTIDVYKKIAAAK